MHFNSIIYSLADKNKVNLIKERIYNIKNKAQSNKKKYKIHIALTRICIEHFDCDFYRDNNPDLHNIREGYLMRHYMQYGKDEKRLPGASLFKKLYPGFDIDFYRKTNLQITGIREMTDDQIMCHYYRYGRFSRVATKFIKK
jgi:hypothetical protein